MYVYITHLPKVIHYFVSFSGLLKKNSEDQVLSPGLRSPLLTSIIPLLFLGKARFFVGSMLVNKKTDESHTQKIINHDFPTKNYS